MRQILWVISVFVLVALIAAFAMLNHHHVVVHLLLMRQETSLITALAVAFGAGALVTLIMLGYPLFSLKMRHHALLRTKRQLEKRLHHLTESEIRDSG